MMDLDSAIRHCEEVAKEKEEDAIIYHNCAEYKQNLYEKGLAKNTEKECKACAEEHRQLAEWLKELKAYRELIDKTEEALGRFDLDNTATYTKFYWDCWKVKEANE